MAGVALAVTDAERPRRPRLPKKRLLRRPVEKKKKPRNASGRPENKRRSQLINRHKAPSLNPRRIRR